MLKLDFTKAFDTIQWPFLLEVLRKMRFGTRWIAWVCGLLGISTTRVMVNGCPGRPIYNARGVRQGAPLSPMLFIFAMEPLQKMVELAASHAIFTPLARSGMQQRILMFADDVMLFIKPNDIDLRVLALILQIFGEVSGLVVNLSKSVAMPIRYNAVAMRRVEAILGCPAGSCPCKYLGLPLTIRRQTSAQFMGLVDCLARKLPTWRASSMPKSGRLLLIKSILSAISIHAMMALDIPQKVILAMRKNL